MSIDGARIKGELDREARLGKGKRVTLYLDGQVYDDFRKHLKKHPPSKAIVKLMREYMATTDGPMRAKYKKARE